MVQSPHPILTTPRIIIDQMVEYGILQKQNNHIIANGDLRLVKRKDGTIRILLDNRLLNNTINKRPVNLPRG